MRTLLHKKAPRRDGGSGLFLGGEQAAIARFWDLPVPENLQFHF